MRSQCHRLCCTSPGLYRLRHSRLSLEIIDRSFCFCFFFFGYEVPDVPRRNENRQQDPRAIEVLLCFCHVYIPDFFLIQNKKMIDIPDNPFLNHCQEPLNCFILSFFGQLIVLKIQTKQNIVGNFFQCCDLDINLQILHRDYFDENYW